MLTITLKKGRDKAVRSGHPWVFSGSIDRVTGAAERGADCQVTACGGEVLGYGYYNADSSISVRLWGSRPMTDEGLHGRIAAALSRRSTVTGADTDVCRLVNSEGDFLPGLIVDRYADGLCMQVLTAGMERRRAAVVTALTALSLPAFIVERSDTEARAEDGLAEVKQVVTGTVPEPLVVRENGRTFMVDLTTGQKTGFYADQRDNRRLAAVYAAGRAVCDCFCYSGAFSVYARTAGALSVKSVDASRGALELAGRNLGLNGLSAAAGDLVRADAFQFLRQAVEEYDMIILDPPKFARHKGDVLRASRGYKDVNLAALKKLRPGGILFTFSCSQAIDPKLFRQIVFAAAADSGRQVQVMHVLSQGPDHPVDIAHLEGEYLKGLVLRVV